MGSTLPSKLITSNIGTALLAAALLMITTSSALAETAEMTTAKAESEKSQSSDYTVSGNLEFNLEHNRGNTDSTDIDFVSYNEAKVARWTHQLRLEASNETADGNRTEEEYKGAWKAKYDLQNRRYAFSNLEYEKDRIAGYEFEASETIGVGWYIIKEEKQLLDVELGVGYRHDRYLDERAHDESVIGYADLDYSLKLKNNAEFKQHFNVKSGEDKTVFLSITSLISQLTDAWFLKISYEFEHTDEVPDGTKHADTTTKVGLLYKY